MKPAQLSYLTHGLRFTSDRPLTGLVPLPSMMPDVPHLSIRFDEPEEDRASDPAGETLWYTTDIKDENGSAALKIWKGKTQGDFFVRYSHGLTFRVNSSVSSVQVHRPRTMKQADVESFWLGPVLGIVLRLRGVTCLHASAVEVSGKAIAFAGAEGAGKSTSAALFAQNGHAVLADDIVALERRVPGFLVYPGHPYLNLLPDSVALLSGSSDVSAEPSWDKIKMAFDGKKFRFQNETLPLGAIYILDGRSRKSNHVVRTLSQQQAFIDLTANTFANKMLDSEMRTKEFGVLSEMAQSVPVRLLDVRGASLKELYRTICEISQGS